jgi:14-3-3 protein epsilon
MADEREGIFYYLRILYSNPNHVQRMEEQEENIASIKRAIVLNPVLSPEERQLLSVTYKNAISSRRSAIKCSTLIIEASQGRPMVRLTDFQRQVRTELREISLDLIRLIDVSLLPVSDLPEPRLFYEKMKADYYRYICESDKESADFETYSRQATAAYETALEVARNDFASTSPSYLGLALNYSVFLYEILQHQNDAIAFAEKVYSETVDLLDSMEESAYSDTTMILQLLRDNFTGWKEFRDQAET